MKRSAKSSRRTRRGFTIVEVLVVVLSLTAFVAVSSQIYLSSMGKMRPESNPAPTQTAPRVSANYRPFGGSVTVTHSTYRLASLRGSGENLDSLRN